MIDGCREWQRQGLNPPEVIREATEKYLTDEDVLEQWIADVGERDPKAWESSAELWTSWKRCAENAGEDVGTKKRLGTRLVERGMVRDRKTWGRGYRGLRLNLTDGEEAS